MIQGAPTGDKKGSDEEGELSASSASNSDSDSDVKEVAGPVKPLGSAINPDTVHAVVDTAIKIEPGIALAAQHKLDEEEAAEDKEELKDEEDLAVQEARKPADERASDKRLNDAKLQKKPGETDAQHDQRLRDAEKAQLKAEKEVPKVLAQIGGEAADKGKLIEPGLAKRAEDAAKVLDAQNAADEAQAEVDAKADADKKAARDKAQHEHEVDQSKLFPPTGKPIKVAAPTGAKVQGLLADFAKYGKKPTTAASVKLDVESVPSVKPIAAAYQHRIDQERIDAEAEQAHLQKPAPRRSPRIAAQKKG